MGASAPRVSSARIRSGPHRAGSLARSCARRPARALPSAAPSSVKRRLAPRHQILDLADLQTANGRLPVSGANFAIGAWAGSRYARAKLVSTSGATRRYQLAIPKTAAVRLFLDTSLNVVDATGMAISAGRPSSTLAAGGQAEVVINLTIP